MYRYDGTPILSRMATIAATVISSVSVKPASLFMAAQFTGARAWRKRYSVTIDRPPDRRYPAALGRSQAVHITGENDVRQPLRRAARSVGSQRRRKRVRGPAKSAEVRPACAMRQRRSLRALGLRIFLLPGLSKHKLGLRSRRLVAWANPTAVASAQQQGQYVSPT